MQARSRALDGIEVATDLVYAQNRIGSIVTSLQPEQVCPTYFAAGDGTTTTPQIAFLQSYNATLQNGRNAMNAFVNQYVSRTTLGLSQVAHATLYTENSVDAAQSYEWLVKSFLIALNLANVFWFFGVLLTRHNVYFPLYHQFLVWGAVPAFAVVLLSTVAATIASSALAITNADFCSGGISEAQPHGSPQGTLQDVLLAKGYNVTDLPYQAIQYYGSDCDGTSPFAFLHNFKVQTQLQRYDLVDRMEDLLDESLNLTQRCGNDTLTTVNVGMLKLHERLISVETILSKASNLTSCAAVGPMFHQLLNGSPCSESPRGLAWLFGTSASLLAIGLAMLSVRAGLYNPVLKPRRIKRREREFREYKEYMANYYQTGDWQMDPSPTKKAKDLASTQTFDTDVTEGDASSSPRTNVSARRSPVSVASDDRSVYTETLSSRGAANVRPRSTGSVGSRRSRFKFVDPGVVYYSSDSDDDSDNDSELDDTSAVSTLFRNVFLTRRGTVPPGGGGVSPSSGASRASHSSSSTSRGMFWFGPRPPPTPTTPAQRLRHLSDLRLEETEGGGAVVLAKESLELQALTPSPELALPARPHKKHKHRCRTVGGSMMDVA